MKQKPRLTFWQIWNMSFGFLGIQFGYGLQNANVSRIFESLGANIGDISILWIAAPVSGLIVQPIVGYMSDKTWCKLGRRRPYFLVGAILASIGLLIMPNSSTLWMAAGMLWILDASINISMEPFRAFVGDVLPDNQRTKGFVMQSFFIGIGAIVASVLPWVMTNWFNIANTAAEGEISLSVKLSFYIGATVFILAILWTVFKAKEYSPEQMKEYENNKDKKNADILNPQKYYKPGFIWTIVGVILLLLINFFNGEKELYILGFGVIIYGLIQLYCGISATKKQTNGLTSIITDLKLMPKTMQQLGVVQFFSWLALFAMWIYTTAGITSDKYNMKINQNINSSLIYSLENAKSNISEEKLY